MGQAQRDELGLGQMFAAPLANQALELRAALAVNGLLRGSANDCELTNAMLVQRLAVPEPGPRDDPTGDFPPPGKQGSGPAGFQNVETRPTVGETVNRDSIRQRFHALIVLRMILICNNSFHNGDLRNGTGTLAYVKQSATQGTGTCSKGAGRGQALYLNRLSLVFVWFLAGRRDRHRVGDEFVGFSGVDHIGIRVVSKVGRLVFAQLAFDEYAGQSHGLAADIGRHEEAVVLE